MSVCAKRIAADTTRYGFVVALPAEARAVAGGRWQRQDGWPVKRRCLAGGDEEIWVQCGIGPRRAAAAARWLVSQRLDCLAVFGVSGGLSPDLVPGDLILASSVIDDCEAENPLRLDLAGEPFRQPLVAAGLQIRRGPILTMSRPILQPAQKAALFEQHGVLAVDMESAAVARVANEAALPCMVLRSVCDPAQRPVPADAFDLVDERGYLSFAALLAALAKRPSLLADLLRMQRDFSPALKALKQAGVVVRRFKAVRS